jgi:hypothetical protein
MTVLLVEQYLLCDFLSIQQSLRLWAFHITFARTTPLFLPLLPTAVVKPQGGQTDAATDALLITNFLVRLELQSNLSIKTME